jgi:hypothetical protein
MTWHAISARPELEVGVVSLMVLNFMWLKFAVIWRFFRLWALLSGVEVPENMLRCVNNNATILGRLSQISLSPHYIILFSSRHESSKCVGCAPGDINPAFKHRVCFKTCVQFERADGVTFEIAKGRTWRG